MAPGDLQLHLESSTRNGIPSQFSPDRDLDLPLTGVSPIQERKERYTSPRAAGCAHTRVSHPHTLPLTWVVRCPHMLIQHGLSRAQFSFMLTHSSQVHSSSTKSHSRLIITHSLLHAHSHAHLAPALTGIDPRGNTFRPFTPDTLPLLPQQAHSKAHQPARLHLLAHPPTPHPPARSLVHSGCRRVLLLRGAPPPRPVHTYGKLPKVAAFPSPSARGGPLSGYQEVNGQCQGGGSSPQPVR